MEPPALSPDEPLRLEALRRLNIVETPLEERFERITRLGKALLGVDIVAISLVEADSQWFKSIQGLNECSTSRADSFCGHTILGDELVVIPDARKDPRFHDNPLVTGGPKIVYYAACPIQSSDGYNLGSLCFIHSETRETTESDLQSIRDLAGLAQSEIQSASAGAMQASLIEDVSAEQRRALIDSMTRMWNRDGILKHAQETITEGNGVAIVMVDLDNFKEANDQYGHASGDEVLRAASRRMLAALRETDLIGRLGGDEFVLVLSPCLCGDDARAIVERVREGLTRSPIRTDGGDIPTTASFGVKFIPPGHKCKLDDVLAEADAALYDTKRTGRDSVTLATGTASALSTCPDGQV